MHEDKKKIFKSLNKIVNFALFALTIFLLVKNFLPDYPNVYGGGWRLTCEVLEKTAKHYIMLSDGDLQKAKEMMMAEEYLSPKQINHRYHIEKHSFEMNDEILTCVKLEKDFFRFGQEKTSIIYNLLTGEKDNQNTSQRVRADTLLEDIFTLQFVLIAIPLKKIFILICKKNFNN